MNRSKNDQHTSVILRFTGKYFFLSNMYPCHIVINDIVFSSAEHAFQAFKCVDVSDFEKIVRCKSGKEARKLGRRVKLRPDWENIKDKVMYHIVEAKFTQNRDLTDKLAATYPSILIEGNTWGDTYWGVDLRVKGNQYKYGYRGLNKLGQILMLIRDKLIRGGT